MMVVVRHLSRAGREPRIRPVVHPELLPLYEESFFENNLAKIETGTLSAGWYLTVPFKAASAKLRRYLRRAPE